MTRGDGLDTPLDPQSQLFSSICLQHIASYLRIIGEGAKQNPKKFLWIHGEYEDVSKKAAGISIERAVDLWGDTVLRLAFCRTRNTADAEDITQTVFLKLCQRAEGFTSDEHMKAWLLRVTITSSADKMREPWNRHRQLLGGANGTEDQPIYNRELNQEESLITEAVALLPEKQRIAIHLFYYEEYPIIDIANIMQENPSTVRSHLHRARAALRTLIGETHG